MLARHPLSSSEQAAADFLSDNMDPNDPSRPSPNDERQWPTAARHPFNKERDAELAELLITTEIMIPSFCKASNSTQRLCQSFLDMVRNPLFDIREFALKVWCSV